MTLPKFLLIAIAFFILYPKKSIAQKRDLEKITDSITNEAQILFKSEWASWYGSDIFSEKCSAKRQLSGGYLSYDTGTGLNNVFFSQGPDPKILATTSFTYDLNPANYKLDTSERKLTAYEKELYNIRQSVIADLNKDTLYKYYKNTNLNPVPIITKKEKRVYILTGPQQSGVVIFGNDYLISFDKNNQIVSKKKIHKSIIPAYYTKPGTDSTKIQLASIHTHLPETGDFITATDICTLLLYEKFTTWNQCIIISKDYVSLWNCKRDKLVILTQEAWKKINAAENALKNNPIK